MPAALANLYCTPQDIYDVAGIDAVQLREDDRNQASGQQVATTAAAAVGATSLTVAALQYALLRGTVLVFDQAGMASPVEATLSAAAAVSATTLTAKKVDGSTTAATFTLDSATTPTSITRAT